MKGGERIIGEYIEEYNGKRLHSAIGWITPDDKLDGKAEDVWRNLDEKLETSRKLRSLSRKTGSVEEKSNQPLTATLRARIFFDVLMPDA